jgi:hypothetical protein
MKKVTTGIPIGWKEPSSLIQITGIPLLLNTLQGFAINKLLK